MTKLLVTAALTLALSMAPLSPIIAQTTPQTMPMMSMMGGGCAMMGMMDRGMMGQRMTGQGMMGQGMMGQGMMAGGMMGGAANMAAMIEGRLAYLRSALNIADAQNVAWTGYAEAVKARVSAVQKMHQGMIEAMQKGSAIERMNARIAGMEAMLEAMKAVRPASEKLYAALNDEQKKLADQLIGMDCGAM
jgi:hypothetical protein